MFAFCLAQNQHNNNTNNYYCFSVRMIIADLFECVKLKKIVIIFLQLIEFFFIILEIIQYAIEFIMSKVNNFYSLKTYIFAENWWNFYHERRGE